MKMRLLLRCSLSLGVICGLLLAVGCKQKNSNPESPAVATVPAQPQAAPPAPPAPPDDQAIRASIQAKIDAESALDARNIHVHVHGGVATLNGSVANDASRALAAADSGSVDGVRTVINNLTVVPQRSMAKTLPAAKPRHQESARLNPPPQPTAETTPAPAPPPQPPPQGEQVQTIAPPPPPPPPKPLVKTVTLAAGVVIPVRMTDTLDSGSTEQDSVFHGSLAADLIVDGMVAAPRGSSVIGKVVTAKKAGHFSGSAELGIQLTSIDVHGREIPVVTDTYTQQGPGRGKNTAIKTGGGAVLGALIGAAAGGGKGAAIGAATGGGIGAGANGVTRGKEVRIAAEALVNFNLQTPISVTTSKVAGQSSMNSNGPVLNRAPQQ